MHDSKDDPVESEAAQSAGNGEPQPMAEHDRQAQPLKDGVLHLGDRVEKPGIHLMDAPSAAGGNGNGNGNGCIAELQEELQRLRDELRSTIKELRTSNEEHKLANEFLATLSHELRTPLSAILLWAQILRSGTSGAAQLQEGLQAITSSGEAQKSLIEDLLDTSRITSGTLRIQLRDVELTPVVREAVDSVLPTAEARGVALKMDLQPDVGEVRADPDRLRQVIWNLLTNAVKFTPSAGKVNVAVHKAETGVQISVSDTGQGIDTNFLPHVFDRFRQADPSATRSYGGLGLGLAIARQLVEMHGGTIRAQSTGPGQGSTFTVELPLPAGRAARAAQDTTRPPKTRSRSAGKETGGGAALAKLRVLLIEDEPQTRRPLTTLLGSAGAEVTAVESAAAALEALEKAKFDAIVSDIGLPGEDGHSLIRRVREKETAAGAAPIPAIALTAFASEKDRRAALHSGFQDHLAKPVNSEQLITLLRMLSSRHQNR